MRSPDDSTRRATEIRSPPGGWTLIIFFRSLTCVLSFESRRVPTFKLQRELATNTNVTVSTTHPDVVNAHAVASNVQNEAANIHTAVSHIHPNLLKSPKDMRGQKQMVSTIVASPATG